MWKIPPFPAICCSVLEQVTIFNQVCVIRIVIYWCGSKSQRNGELIRSINILKELVVLVECWWKFSFKLLKIKWVALKICLCTTTTFGHINNYSWALFRLCFTLITSCRLLSVSSLRKRFVSHDPLKTSHISWLFLYGGHFSKFPLFLIFPISFIRLNSISILR